MKFVVRIKNAKDEYCSGDMAIMPQIGDSLFAAPHDPTSSYRIVDRSFDIFDNVVYLIVEPEVDS